MKTEKDGFAYSIQGRCIGKTFGYVRMVHARAPAAIQPTAPAVIPVNDDCVFIEQAEPRQHGASREAC